MRQATEELDERDPALAAGTPGFYLEFAVAQGQNEALEKLEDRRQHIEVVAVREPAQEGEGFAATVFVPQAHAGSFLRKVEAYREQETPTGHPRYEALLARIDDVRFGSVQSLYTDKPELFPADGRTIWWEVWLRSGTRAHFGHAARLLRIRTAEHSLSFPERDVILALASASVLGRVLQHTDAVAELRIAKDTPSVFLEMSAIDEAAWAAALAARTVPPPNDAVAVCVLDTGVNQAHPLLSSALDPADMLACQPAWGVADQRGHGTAMAGLALYGDLTPLLAGDQPVQLEHRLESVKIMPDGGRNPPELYGAITADAIAQAELNEPWRRRVACLAMTSAGDSRGGRPSAWSAALDQLCHGGGDSQRLIVVAAGNVRDLDPANYPGVNDASEIESPAQSWNALTIGAFTEKTNVLDEDFREWDVIASPGLLCPQSRTSVPWSSQWPIKPDVVLEGGNALWLDANGGVFQPDDLMLLSTNHDLPQGLFRSFSDTSAATGLGAQFAARVFAGTGGRWPETIRALIVHSAAWTDSMLEELGPTRSSTAKRSLLRRYGYGVPDLRRAVFSARNDLTLVVQDELQPFERHDGRIRSREMHFHRFPWPEEELQALGEAEVELRVTLSYFIEPNPGDRGWDRRHRYASHGLRFAVKRTLETEAAFRARVNAAIAGEEGPAGAAEPDRWFLGPRLRDTGSVHSDIWRGSAADLAAKDAVGVLPVAGWWKERPGLARWDSVARYALVVSIRIAEDVDIYTPVLTAIAPRIEIRG